MYQGLLYFHSWWRWVVLLLAISAITHAWCGVVRRWEWTKQTRMHTALLAGALDVQVLVGLILYVFVSPLTRQAFADFGAVMANPSLRFWVLEHGPTMLVALALVRVGIARARKAPNDALRYRRIARWGTAAFALMFAATPWPWLDIGRPLLRGM